MMLLPTKVNPGNGFTVARVHYSADPDKNTPEWIAKAKQGMTERGWLREYDIDYSTYGGKPFFEFKELNISKHPIEYKQGEVLYRGWDFGFHRPCCLITKLDEFDRWCWMKVILGKDEGIMDFGKRVRKFCLSEYPGAKYLDAADPAGNQVSDKSEKTSIEILNLLGIAPQSRKQPIYQGAEIIRQKLQMRTDGKMGLLVDPSETDIIDGFKGGLHYPDVYTQDGRLLDGKREPDFYEKDGYFDHIFDSGRYIATEMFTVIGQQQERNELATNEIEQKYRMGSPFTSSEHQQESLNDYGMGDLFNE